MGMRRTMCAEESIEAHTQMRISKSFFSVGMRLAMRRYAYALRYAPHNASSETNDVPEPSGDVSVQPSDLRFWRPATYSHSQSCNMHPPASTKKPTKYHRAKVLEHSGA